MLMCTSGTMRPCSSCKRPSSLKTWQDYKFGLFLHWGAYSQIGVDASWSLNWATACAWGNPGLCAPKNCSECTHHDMEKYREKYWGKFRCLSHPRLNTIQALGLFPVCADVSLFILVRTAFKQRHAGLSKTFNPTKFNPTVWADAASKAGMQYFVMTTKHHDGFAMYVRSKYPLSNRESARDH